MNRPAHVILLLWVALCGAALAVNPDEVLADPALEARARVISGHLRCLVCQNQSIDDSDADLARDLRLLVRERLSAGDTDAEATQFIVDRYGEFVLLQPVFGLHTALLWITAPLLLILGAAGMVIATRRRRAEPVSTALSGEEEAALAGLAGSRSVDARASRETRGGHPSP